MAWLSTYNKKIIYVVLGILLAVFGVTNSAGSEIVSLIALLAGIILVIKGLE